MGRPPPPVAPPEPGEPLEPGEPDDPKVPACELEPDVPAVLVLPAVGLFVPSPSPSSLPPQATNAVKAVSTRGKPKRAVFMSISGRGGNFLWAREGEPDQTDLVCGSPVTAPQDGQAV
jgi:hypothetical protein